MGEQKVKTIEGGETVKKSHQAAKAAVSSPGKKIKRKIGRGRIFIQSTYNNTLITVTDQQGNTLGWGSAGATGFKGSKKSTPYAAQKTMEETLSKLKNFGLSEVEVFIKGIGSGRDSAIRALQSADFSVTTIKDITPIKHGGVRPKKVRRV